MRLLIRITVVSFLLAMSCTPHADAQSDRSATIEQAIEVARQEVSLAQTSSDSLRSTEIRQSVHRPKTPSLVGDRATGIVRPSALHGHTGVAREDGERAGWAAELDL